MPDVAVKVHEGAPTKGRRYLLEGRLRVRSVKSLYVDAVCRGDGETYRLGWVHGDWFCTCPAKTPSCAHLRALRLVVDRP